MEIVNIYENYNKYFNGDFKAVFEQLSKIASISGHKLYLIGGIVRDLLLEKENFDIDITVEGDAIEFVKVLENERSAKIVSLHESFGTAKIEIQGKKIDFASTRSEIYPKKGHLPVVEKIACPLELDVVRRDFTVNSLALSLNQNNFADLIDYVGGFEDLKSKKLRILHEKSFIDDPTRIIRGLKFSVRFGFELEKDTLKLQEEYLRNIDYDMSYKRVKKELKEAFELNSQGLFEKFIDERIYKLITQLETRKPTKNIENLIIKYRPKHHWLVYLGIVGALESDDFSDKLELTKSEKTVIVGAKSLLGLQVPDDDFGIYRTFGAYGTESLLILAIYKEEKKVFHYLENLKKIKLSITGQDLLELGIEPSKLYSEVFDHVLKQKLMTPMMKKSDEIALLRGFCN